MAAGDTGRDDGPAVPDGQHEPLLAISGLRIEFETPDGPRRAVDGVDLAIGAGETLGLVGESGCGKSVTALSIMGLLPRSGKVADGSIRLDGLELTAMTESRLRGIRGGTIGMIFQDPMTSLNPVLTVGRQLTEALRAHRPLSRSEARARAVELLEAVSIPDAEGRMGQYPHQLSGGLRQRVMIAMAISCEPRLVLADEPTTALDVTIQAQILELLRDLSRALPTSLMLITHDLGVVAGMTRRVAVMYAGVIVEQASTDDLFADPRMPYSWGLLTSIVRLDQERDGRLVPIEGAPPTLGAMPGGCRFAPRCRFRRDVCDEREPELGPLPMAAPDHLARCWATQAGGWLMGKRWPGVLAEPAAPSAA